MTVGTPSTSPEIIKFRAEPAELSESLCGLVCLKWAQVGLKLTSSWIKLASSGLKLASSWLKMALWCLELAQVGLKLVQVEPKLAPSCLEMGSSWPQVGSSWAEAGSKLAQVGLKISSGRLQEVLLKGLGRVQGGSWEVLGARRSSWRPQRCQNDVPKNPKRTIK